MARTRAADIEYLSRCFRTSLWRTRRLVKDLIVEGLLEPDETGPVEFARYRISRAGRRLSLATAAAPISRATADREVAEFLERVRLVNDDERYLYRVRRVIVFGSYLTDQPSINDVDLAVELERRVTDPALFMTKTIERVVEAERAGRSFASYFAQLIWPHTEVLLKLKARSRSISLHSTDDPVLGSAASREIFHEDEVGGT
jgi:predicted nucleotidyltransferase